MANNSKDLIQCILKGENSQVLKYLYKDPLRKIRAYILNNSGTIDDANDVFQDAVVVLFHYVKTGKYKKEHDIDGFLFRVAKNAWIDLVRKNKNISKQELHGFDIKDDTDILDDYIQSEKLDMFHQLFNKLEENCRKILTYVVFDKKSMREIAELLGHKNEKVVKNQHYRCKKYFSKLVFENQDALKMLRY